MLTYTVFGIAWPEEWPRELAGEVVAVALLAVVVAVLRGRTSEAQAGVRSAQGWRSGAALGTVGLLTLTVIHLVAGAVYSAWTMADSWRLLVAAGLLAVLVGWALIASGRTSRPRLR
jgi:cellobiose-specific phosphotransferase system component IIC